MGHLEKSAMAPPGQHRLPRSLRRRLAEAASVLALGTGLVFPCFASCSFIKPEVGKFRGSCKASGGGYERPDAYAPGQPDPRCTPDENDDTCAVCEDMHCCETRFGCYDDDTCSCADEEFDKCLEAIADPTSEEGAAATTQCWAVFSGSNPRAQARVECQREFCKEECGVP